MAMRVRQFQIVHSAPYSIVVRIIPSDPDDQSIVSVVQQRISKVFSGDVDVRVNIVSDMTTTKRGKRESYVREF